MYTSNNWDALVFGGVGSKHEVEPLPVTSDTATVIEIKRRERDSYGEGFEDESRGGYVIFQVGDRFFKRTFGESSYDENFTWNGPVKEVYGTTKTVTVFVPK